MASDKDDRKDRIRNHLDILQKGSDDLQESKSILKTNIAAAKESLGYIERTDWEITKNIRLLQSVDIDKANECDENTWQNYVELYNRNKDFYVSGGNSSVGLCAGNICTHVIFKTRGISIYAENIDSQSL